MRIPGSTTAPAQPIEKIVSVRTKLGNPYFQKKYEREWKKSLNSCSHMTAKFLSENTGLFHVESTAKFFSISLEVAQIPDLKSKLKQFYKHPEIQSAFSQGFGKQTKVMLRLA